MTRRIRISGLSSTYVAQASQSAAAAAASAADAAAVVEGFDAHADDAKHDLDLHKVVLENQLDGLVFAADASADAAAASAADAADSAQQAADLILLDLGTSDGQLTAIDANPASAYRVQRDARLATELATATPSDLASVGVRATGESMVAETGLIAAQRDGLLVSDGRVATDLLDGQNTQVYSLSNCTASNDTSRKKQGTQSKRFTTTGAVTATTAVDPVFPAPAPDPLTFAPASCVRAWVWVDDPTRITSMTFEIYSDSAASTSNKWARSAANSAAPLTRGWNLLTWSAADGVLTGWGSAYRVRTVVVTSAATSWNIGRFWVESPPKAKILLIADRGYKSFKDNGLPDLRSRGIPVTWALDPALNGSNPGTAAEAITDGDVATFYAAGDDISIHSYDGMETSTKTGPQIVEDALRGLKWLHDHGYSRGRTVRAAWVQNNAPQHAYAQPYFAAYATPSAVASSTCYPFPDRFNIPRWGLSSRTEANIDLQFANLQATHGLLVCYIHGIDDTSSSNVTPAMWAYIISKIDAGIAGGWLEGVTFSQLLNNRPQMATTITYGTNTAAAVTQYTTPQVDTAYAIPAGAKKLRIRVLAPGGPGGSGRRGAAGTVRRGGDSGAGGGYTEWDVNVADLPVSTLYVTVGTPGTPGAAVTNDDTNGNPGVIGTASMVKTSTATAAISNVIAYAYPGNPGLGGTATTGTAALAGNGRWIGAVGVAASATGLVGPGGNGVTSGTPSGGAGGGLSAANAESAGGTGGYASGHFASTPAAGAAGGGAGGAGANPPFLSKGSAGGGGGSSLTTDGGAGGAGGYGAGGGGGGASVNGNNSGAGGAGGGGFVEITAEFS